MIPNLVLTAQELNETMRTDQEPTWAIHAMLLWKHRRKLARVTAIFIAAKARVELLQVPRVVFHHHAYYG
jgi:hypothetical protein